MNVLPLTESDRQHIRTVVRQFSGDDFTVSRGRKIYPFMCGGFIAWTEDGRAVGIATYELMGKVCELGLIEVFEKRRGTGTILVKSVEEAARKAGCKRLMLTTTNDNNEAMRFYEKLGYIKKAVHPGAMAEYRKIKPGIPLIGKNGIEIRDEIEYEKNL